MKVQKSRIKSLGVNKMNYTGEYQVVFYRFDKSLQEYEIGDRVCQLKVGITPKIRFTKTFNLKETDRGTGGFGSTGR